MKHGIYYAYWEKQWQADYIPYIEKAAHLGFDILEIAASPSPSTANNK
jgi:D-psicose/D-tagatose/L-ribulose 3-epimerase